MRRHRGKLLLLLLVPLALYGIAKGLMYYKAKQAVDDMVMAAANHADVVYAGISTDLAGSVTVSGIRITPLGTTSSVSVDAVRVRSDDPMFFITGVDWQPGSDAPPPHMAIDVSGVEIPLEADFLDLPQVPTSGADAGPCAHGLNLGPTQLREIGFDALHLDLSGYYRLDAPTAKLVAGFQMGLRDMQSISADVSFENVDVAALDSGAPPQFSLGALHVVIDVDPAFGRQMLKSCAVGSDKTVDDWSRILAERALQDFESQGVQLGHGLTRAVHDFHRDWGAFSIEARPEKPVGVLSLMFLPPDQLSSVLGLHMRLNDVPIADTSFVLAQPDVPGPAGLAAMFGAEPEPEAANPMPRQPQRILVSREFEAVAIADIGRYVGSPVRIQPRAQPLREGVLTGIANGEVEVEQQLLGGKFTAYVPLDEIDKVEVLVQRRIEERIPELAAPDQEQ